jgi:hypothetical protein
MHQDFREIIHNACEHFSAKYASDSDKSKIRAAIESGMTLAILSDCAHEAAHLTAGMAIGAARGFVGEAFVDYQWNPSNPTDPIQEADATLFRPADTQLTDTEAAIFAAAGKMGEWIAGNYPGKDPMTFEDSPEAFLRAFNQAAEEGTLSDTDAEGIAKAGGEMIPIIEAVVNLLKQHEQYFLWARNFLMEHGIVPRQHSVVAWDAIRRGEVPELD